MPLNFVYKLHDKSKNIFKKNKQTKKAGCRILVLEKIEHLWGDSPHRAIWSLNKLDFHTKKKNTCQALFLPPQCIVFHFILLHGKQVLWEQMYLILLPTWPGNSKPYELQSPMLWYNLKQKLHLSTTLFHSFQISEI